MQNVDSQLSERLRQAMLADESVLHKFISAAGEWLRDNHGATADDPGYFD